MPADVSPRPNVAQSSVPAAWQETMLASRDAFLAWTRQEGLVLLERSVAEDPWYVTAPLKCDGLDDSL